MPCRFEESPATPGAPTCLEPTAQLTESQAMDLFDDVTPAPEPVHEPTTPILNLSQPTPVPFGFTSVTDGVVQADAASDEAAARSQFADTAVDTSPLHVKDKTCAPSVSSEFASPLKASAANSLLAKRAERTTHSEPRDSSQKGENMLPSSGIAQPHPTQSCLEGLPLPKADLQVTRQHGTKKQVAPTAKPADAVHWPNLPRLLLLLTAKQAPQPSPARCRSWQAWQPS